MTSDTATITDVAQAFVDACETGRGWEGCSGYCHPDAGFSAQAAPLADARTVRDCTEWMKGLLTVLPDGRYEVRALATDPARDAVCVYAVFTGTHTGDGGPVPPTGRRTTSDHVYGLEFDGGRISGMTKIWNSGHALEELGWAG
ncbi:ester cyclase [Blastococcus sp. SYSU D00669]